MGKKKAPKNNKKLSNRKRSDEDEAPPRKVRKRRGRNTKILANSVDDAKLRESLEHDGSKTIIDIDADGNCLFRSLSDQLYWDFGNHHSETRNEVCDYLEAFEEEFSVFLVLDEEEEDEDAADFETYVNNMRQDGEWAGNVELVAAARLYRRNITVFSASLAAFTINHGTGKESAGPDMLLSYHDNDHYNSVRDNKVGKPPPPIKTFVKTEDGEHEDAATEDMEVDAEPKDVSTSEDRSNNSDPPMPTKKKTNVKKGAPCPCGSGLKYRKCCSATQKRGKRAKKVRKGESTTEDSTDESDPEMDGSFRVLKI